MYVCAEGGREAGGAGASGCAPSQDLGRRPQTPFAGCSMSPAHAQGRGATRCALHLQGRQREDAGAAVPALVRLGVQPPARESAGRPEESVRRQSRVGHEQCTRGRVAPLTRVNEDGGQGLSWGGAPRPAWPACLRVVFVWFPLMKEIMVRPWPAWSKNKWLVACVACAGTPGVPRRGLP